MEAARFIVSYLSCWSVMLAGAYLAVTGMAGLVRRLSPESEASTVRGVLASGWRVLSGLRDLFLLLLGAVVAVSAMLLLYDEVFG
ncbi:MAG: hypothetical protein QME71_04150 [Dehalococcoidia bacterium]|nr:hypothetical protein [Dehalococcoidia bacterium]